MSDLQFPSFRLGVLDEKLHTQEPCCSDLFLFPDESGNVSQEPSPAYASLTHHLISDTMAGAPTENDDFCILFAPKAAIQVTTLITQLKLENSVTN